MPDAYHLTSPPPARLLSLLLTLADADSSRQKAWFYAALGLLSIGTLG